MRRMEWLDEFKDIIICLYEEGMKQTEIAKEFEVSQGTISLRLRKWGASDPDGNRFKRNDIDKETLHRLYWDEEMHPSQIAEIYGCHKQTVTNFLIKYGIPRRTKSEARKGKLNPIYKTGHTKKARKKMSDAFVNGRKIGFNNHWGVGSYYDSPNQGKVWMRSGWETSVADYLTKEGLNWYYESHWITLSESQKYLPDFYIPDLDLYIEVKGRIKSKDKKIIKLMYENKYKFLFWDAEELIKRKIISNPGSTKLYRKYINKEKYIDNWEVYKKN